MHDVLAFYSVIVTIVFGWSVLHSSEVSRWISLLHPGEILSILATRLQLACLRFWLVGIFVISVPSIKLLRDKFADGVPSSVLSMISLIVSLHRYPPWEQSC